MYATDSEVGRTRPAILITPTALGRDEAVPASAELAGHRTRETAPQVALDLVRGDGEGAACRRNLGNLHFKHDHLAR
jgi:hypothetical protein